MKQALTGFVLGLILGAGGVTLYLLSRADGPSIARAETRSPSAMEEARGVLAETVAEAGAALEAKLEALELRADDVRTEMAETGRVIRRRARELGARAADATADARITTEVKAKLIADRQLSALDVSVATSDGRVTLSGEVPRPELVGRAMLLAYETAGVREVISTIQVPAPS